MDKIETVTGGIAATIETIHSDLHMTGLFFSFIFSSILMFLKLSLFFYFYIAFSVLAFYMNESVSTCPQTANLKSNLTKLYEDLDGFANQTLDVGRYTQIAK